MAAEKYDLSNLTPDSKNAKVDIVFIHGLDDEKKTWTSINQSSKKNVFWPRDLLAEDVPEVRIFNFRYPAFLESFWGGASSDLREISRNLLGGLTEARHSSNTTNRPIIFIAHSVGGLVCVQALLIAEEDQTREPILNSTRGILFFGTPHEGPKPSSWQDRGKVFCSYCGKSRPSAMPERAKALAHLGSKFPDLLKSRDKEQKISIYCLYEMEEAFHPKRQERKKIVPELSACLDGYAKYGIARDHWAMCQFDGSGDEGYRKVSSVLKAWVEEFQEKPATGGITNNVTTTYSGKTYGGSNIGQLNLGGGNATFSGGTFTFTGNGD